MYYFRNQIKTPSKEEYLKFGANKIDENLKLFFFFFRKSGHYLDHNVEHRTIMKTT